MKVVTEWSRNGSKIEENIPHADLIRAVLDGKVVQNFWHGKWNDWEAAEAVQHLAVWQEQDGDVRLKPEPHVRWLPVWPGVGHTGDSFDTKASLLAESESSEYQPGFRVLRLELDRDTAEVISAKTEDA